MDDPPPTRIAVYLDFENLVISQYDSTFGRGKWASDRPARGFPAAVMEKVRAAAVDVDAIIDYAASIGVVTICRAYGNWAAGAFAEYGPALTRRSVDLVQMFPLAGSKNGADIRLATDVIEDLARFPHLTHVLIAAGDSDYLSVAQKARRLGKQVVGVGVEGSIGRYWEAACDEFKRYHTLVRTETGDSTDPATGDVGDPQELIVRALRLCVQQRGTDRIPLPALKQVIRRISPGFDEQALGFKTFSSFLHSFSDTVATDSMNNYVWLATGQPATEGPGSEDPEPEDVIARCRGQLPYISRSAWPLADSDYRAVIQSARTLWELLGDGEHEDIPHGAWSTRLIDTGMEPTDATRTRSFAQQILRAATKSETGYWIPNPDLHSLDDPALISRLFTGIVVRMHLRCPDATVEDLAAAIHGPAATDEQVDGCRKVVDEFDLATRLPR